MCLVAILNRVVDEAPIIIGANREEYYARGGNPPQIETNACSFLAGKDPVGGGTWLGVNQHGLIVAVTNRAKEDIPDAPRSRGLLTRDLLQCLCAKDAVQHAVRELESNVYAGCNFLLADLDQAVIVHGGDMLEIRPLPIGIHILATTTVNNISDERSMFARQWLAHAPLGDQPQTLASVRKLCSFTGNGEPPICLKGKDRGTVSSSVIALARERSRSEYWHAPGSPDQHPYGDYSHLFRQVMGSV